MGASAADSPTSPEFLRASDADRDHAVDALKKGFVEGRLSHDTFMVRMQAALGARNNGQLARLFKDLPPRRTGPGILTRMRAAVRGGTQNARAAGAALADAALSPLMFPRGTAPVVTIGRDQGCDMFIPDMSVSRVHAQMARADGGWLLADLGSTNGTRLNGWRVTGPVPVRAGDQVRFGSAAFVLRDESWFP